MSGEKCFFNFSVCVFFLVFYSLGSEFSMHNEQPREHERVMKWKTFYRLDFVFDHVSWIEIHAMKLSTRLIHLFIYILYIGNVHSANSGLCSMCILYMVHINLWKIYVHFIIAIAILSKNKFTKCLAYTVHTLQHIYMFNHLKAIQIAAAEWKYKICFQTQYRQTKCSVICSCKL